MNMRRILVIGGVVVFLVMPVVIYAIYTAINKVSDINGQTTVYIDKDTGETVTSYSELTTENVGNAPVVVLGLQTLNEDVLREQFLFIRDSIGAYGYDTLKKEFGSVTLLPSGYTISQHKMTGELRLGTSSTTVSITVIGLDTGKLRVTIKDPDGKYPSYDSGVKTLYVD